MPATVLPVDRLSSWLAGKLPGGAVLAAVAARRSGLERLPLLCYYCPAERLDATAATARRSGLPPTDGAAGCRSGAKPPVSLAAARQRGSLLCSLRLEGFRSLLLLPMADGLPGGASWR